MSVHLFKLVGSDLQQQKTTLDRFVQQQGYLCVENKNGVKRIKLIDKPGFFENLSHLFYKPKSQRYETVSSTLFQLLEANPELAEDAYRLAPFLSKRLPQMFRLKSLMLKKNAQLRQEALEQKGDCWIRCAQGTRVSAHAARLRRLEWFSIVLNQRQFQKERPPTIDLSGFQAKHVEILLDFIYDDQINGECSQEDRFLAYNLMNYVGYPYPDEMPGFYQDCLECTADDLQALHALALQDLKPNPKLTRDQYDLSKREEELKKRACASKIEIENPLPKKTSAEYIYGPEVWKRWNIEVLDKVPPPTESDHWHGLDPYFKEPFHKNYVAIYFPKRVRINEGKPKDLTLSDILEVHSFAQVSTKIRKELGGTTSAGQWILISKKMLQESLDQDYAAQKKMVEQKNRYRLPTLMEAIVLNLMVFERSGDRLFGRDPIIYARCQEQENQFPLVGNFGSHGLLVLSDRPTTASPYYGSAIAIQ